MIWQNYPTTTVKGASSLYSSCLCQQKLLILSGALSGWASAASNKISVTLTLVALPTAFSTSPAPTARGWPTYLIMPNASSVFGPYYEANPSISAYVMSPAGNAHAPSNTLLDPNALYHSYAGVLGSHGER